MIAIFCLISPALFRSFALSRLFIISCRLSSLVAGFCNCCGLRIHTHPASGGHTFVSSNANEKSLGRRMCTFEHESDFSFIFISTFSTSLSRPERRSESRGEEYEEEVESIKCSTASAASNEFMVHWLSGTVALVANCRLRRPLRMLHSKSHEASRNALQEI